MILASTVGNWVHWFFAFLVAGLGWQLAGILIFVGFIVLLLVGGVLWGAMKKVGAFFAWLAASVGAVGTREFTKDRREDGRR